MDITVTMSKGEYDKQMWVLSAISRMHESNDGDINDFDEIRNKVVGAKDSPYENFEGEDIESTLDELVKANIVNKIDEKYYLNTEEKQ